MFVHCLLCHLSALHWAGKGIVQTAFVYSEPNWHDGNLITSEMRSEYSVTITVTLNLHSCSHLGCHFHYVVSNKG